MVERFADRQMDTLAARANHETGSDYDLEVLRALLITERDVMKLVDMGYLTQEQQGKRFVFTPTSRLQELFPAPSLARLRGFAVDLLTPEFPPGSFSA